MSPSEDERVGWKLRPRRATNETPSRAIDAWFDSLIGTAPPQRTLAHGIDTTGDGRKLAHVLFPAQEPQMDNQSL